MSVGVDTRDMSISVEKIKKNTHRFFFVTEIYIFPN